MMADNVEHVISYRVIFQAFHSPTLAGFAVISHWTPFLVLGVWYGGLADRYDCRKIIIASQVAFIAVVLALAWGVSILVFALTPVYAIAVLALLVAGVLNIGFTSMAQAYVQLEAPPSRRGRVVGLFSMSWNGLRVGSGVTVGIVGAGIGIHYSLALSALAFLAVGLALLVYANGRAREAVTA